MNGPSAGSAAPAAGSDFHYASLYYRPHLRRELHVLEAVRCELVAIPEDCSDRGVAHVKLAWWREELSQLGARQPRHHLARALVPLAVREPALVTAYTALLDGLSETLADRAPATRDEVLESVERQQAGIITACARRGGATSAEELARVQRLAALIELARALNGLRRHRRAGTLLLGEDQLARHGLTREDVRHAPDSSSLGALLSDEMQVVGALLQAGLAAQPAALRRRQRLYTTLARIAARTLALTVEDGCHVLERRIEPTPLEKLWIAWRTRYFG